MDGGVYINTHLSAMSTYVGSTSLSVARGCGWQHFGAYVNLGSFYLVGIPLGLFLGFGLKMDGKGLWMGIACGSVLQFLLLSIIAFFSNWQKMTDKARDRIFGETLSEKQSLV
ncbi:hypothetical protein GUJ93_ZPchr0010g11126 [Zizania palustris]|uniref:Protein DETOXIFICATION n=1 Tax=Zizania palustris TaxID=103762 RepID=A0A8J5WBI2_ZIZPA|nr:hypothetical protein GUJ93_ZPchr0375g18701 [Zizania palustris]KAG8086360.1 hypothetical protein GUJ93_ZPchr0010g11126 [Zizania palustris]